MEIIPALVILVLREFKVISAGLATVLHILYGIFLVLNEILSGRWVWGSSRTNYILGVLTINVFVLVFIENK
jgi:hypothetical protein